MNHANHVVIASPSKQDLSNLALLDEDDDPLREQFTSVGRVKHIQQDGTVIHTNWQGQEEILNGIKVDTIVYCTGYTREFPFLSNKLQPVSITADGQEVSSCFMFTAHKAHPNSLFFFHPAKARTPFNTMARDTHAQARLMASLATRTVFSREEFVSLDQTLHYWLNLLHMEWSKETLNSCPCAVQNPFLMNFLHAIVDYAIDYAGDYENEISDEATIGMEIIARVRRRMKKSDFRKQNTIWHAGMNLRVRPDAVNWNLFRFLKGKLTGGPDVDGSDSYTVTWFLEDGHQHSTYREDEIKYEDLILNEPHR